jgi:hypothetical protein
VSVSVIAIKIALKDEKSSFDKYENSKTEKYVTAK